MCWYATYDGVDLTTANDTVIGLLYAHLYAMYNKKTKHHDGVSLDSSHGLNCAMSDIYTTLR